MLDFFQKLLDTTDFPPRWYCGTWSSGVGWLHIISDIATFAAYVAIPMTTIWIVRRRGRDFNFPKLAWLFAAFVFACGSVHLVEAIIFWFPVYRLSGLLKLITALVSWASVIAAIRITPLALQMPGALAMNESLRIEIDRRTETEERLTAILDSMSDGVVVSDVDGNIQMMNPAANEIFQFQTPEYLYSERLKTYSLSCDDGATVVTGDRLPLRRAARGEAIDDLEIQVSCPSRSIEKTIRLKARPIRLRSDPRVAAVVVVHDITHLKQIADDRNHQLQRLEKLTDAAARVTQSLQHADVSDEGYLRVIADCFQCTTIMLAMRRHGDPTVDTDGDQDLITLRTHRFSRRSPSAVAEVDLGEMSKETFEKICEEDLMTRSVIVDELPDVAPGLRNVAIGGLPIAGEIRGMLILSDRGVPFSDDELDLLKRISRMVSAAIFARNQIAAEEKRRFDAESRLAASRKELERLTRINSVGEMTAGIAHELNQPLTAMINFTDAARRIATEPVNPTTQPELLQLTQSANEQAIRAADVLKSIRSMVQRDAVHFSEVNLKQMVVESGRLLRDEIRDKNAILRWSGVSSEINLQADRIQVEQMIVNLIRNGLHAISQSDVREIILTATEDQKNIMLTIHDSGPGFDQEDKDRLFDAFFTRRGKGLGLGLKICRSITELHGGQIHADNHPDGGARFTVILPITQIPGPEITTTDRPGTNIIETSN